MKRAVRWCLAATLVLAGAGCGDDGTSATSTSTAPATSRATTAPTSGATTAPTSGATTAPTLAVSELLGLALTAADLGSGWVAKADVGVEDLGSLADVPCPDSAVNPTIAARLRATAAVAFQATGASVSSRLRGVQELMLSGDPGRLSLDLDAVFDASTACAGTEVTTVDGEKTRFDLLTAPMVGDQRIVARVTVFEPPDFATTWRGHSAIVRVGRIVVMVNEFEILSTPTVVPTMTDDGFLALLQRAVERIEVS